MDSHSLAVSFTDILKTCIKDDWDEYEVSRLVCCMLRSNNKVSLSSNQIRNILKNSKSFNGVVFSLLIKQKLISSKVIFEWVLELDYLTMVETLQKCFDEEAFTVLPEYNNNILVKYI